MKVYLIIHGTYETEVRGAYATRELAEEALVWSEYGRDDKHEWWYSHNEHCCGVEEADVRERVERPFHGPENVDRRNQQGGSLIYAAFSDALLAYVDFDGPYRAMLVDGSRPIGTAESATTTDGELGVVVKLRDEP